MQISFGSSGEYFPNDPCKKAKTAKVAPEDIVTVKAKVAQAVVDAHNAQTEGKKSTRLAWVRQTILLVFVLFKWIRMTTPFHNTVVIACMQT